MDIALAEAREKELSPGGPDISGLDMLPSSEFAKFIGISPEAVVPSNSEAKFLGLKGAKVQ